MKAARLPSLLPVALVVMVVLGLGLAVGGLLALRDVGAMAIFAIAMLAGLLAAGATYLVTRNAMLLVEPGPADATPPEAPVFRTARAPATIDALPVADLPAPYVAAVMKGLHANRRALAGNSRSTGRQAGA